MLPFTIVTARCCTTIHRRVSHRRYRLACPPPLTQALTSHTAKLYPGGSTLHALAGLTLCKRQTDLCRSTVAQGSNREVTLQRAALIVIDEVSSLNRGCLEATDELLRSVGSRAVVVLAGDFRQTMPVVKSDAVVQLVDASVVSSPLWPSVTRFELKGKHRFASDPNFADWLDTVGDGTVEAASPPEDAPTVTDGKYIDMSAIPNVSVDDTAIMKHVYGPNLDDFKQSAIMCPINRADDVASDGHRTPPGVDAWNRAVQQARGLEPRAYPAHNIVVVDEGQAKFGEAVQDSGMLDDVNESGVPDSILHLAEGDICFVMRTFDKRAGLVTNARVEIVKLHANTITVKLIDPDTHDDLLSVPRINTIFQMGRSNLSINRKQFPLQLCYAITFNKAQGQTLSRVAIDLRHVGACAAAEANDAACRSLLRRARSADLSRHAPPSHTHTHTRSLRPRHALRGALAGAPRLRRHARRARPRRAAARAVRHAPAARGARSNANDRPLALHAARDGEGRRRRQQRRARRPGRARAHLGGHGTRRQRRRAPAPERPAPQWRSDLPATGAAEGARAPAQATAAR